MPIWRLTAAATVSGSVLISLMAASVAASHSSSTSVFASANSLPATVNVSVGLPSSASFALSVRATPSCWSTLSTGVQT
jgi:hypothetical protein